MSRATVVLQVLGGILAILSVVATYLRRRRENALFDAGVGVELRADTRAILDRAQRDARLQHATSIEPAMLLAALVKKRTDATAPNAHSSVVHSIPYTATSADVIKRSMEVAKLRDPEGLGGSEVTPADLLTGIRTAGDAAVREQARLLNG